MIPAFKRLGRTILVMPVTVAVRLIASTVRAGATTSKRCAVVTALAAVKLPGCIDMLDCVSSVSCCHVTCSVE